MFIIVNAKYIEWNKETVNYDEVLALQEPPTEPGKDYIVHYAVVPKTHEGESLDMYSDEKILESGATIALIRPLIFRSNPAILP